jgi:orotidine 5'-phosphate decarboxylase subfamily 1
MSHTLNYIERSYLCSNPTAIRLFEIMHDKQSNLAIAADVTSSNQLLHLANILGPSLCVLKTHIDILEDFSPDVVAALVKLAKKHRFLIFEDRKFADIGNTVKQQYREGIYKISSWSDLTNAHVIPGPGIIEGLKEVGLPLGKGLLLLAEMSSKGSLATGNYTKAAIDFAQKHCDFVIGFIAQRRLLEDPRFIHMTPGVSLSHSNDALGQNYTSPQEIIGRNKSDIIIVGRSIIGADDPLKEAIAYQKAGWDAYFHEKQ